MIGYLVTGGERIVDSMKDNYFASSIEFSYQIAVVRLREVK